VEGGRTADGEPILWGKRGEKIEITVHTRTLSIFGGKNEKRIKGTWVHLYDSAKGKRRGHGGTFLWKN